MNKEDTEKAIAVMQAFVDGEEIEYKNSSGVWRAPKQGEPAWNFYECEYRVKPKPHLECNVVFSEGSPIIVIEEGMDIPAFAKIYGHRVVKMREVKDE